MGNQGKFILSYQEGEKKKSLQITIKVSSSCRSLQTHTHTCTHAHTHTHTHMHAQCLQALNLIIRRVLLLVARAVARGDVDFCQAGRADQLQVRHRPKVASLAGGWWRLLQVQGLAPIHQLWEVALVLKVEITLQSGLKIEIIPQSGLKVYIIPYSGLRVEIIL